MKRISLCERVKQLWFLKLRNTECRILLKMTLSSQWLKKPKMVLLPKLSDLFSTNRMKMKREMLIWTFMPRKQSVMLFLTKSITRFKYVSLRKRCSRRWKLLLKDLNKLEPLKKTVWIESMNTYLPTWMNLSLKLLTYLIILLMMRGGLKLINMTMYSF